MHSFINEFEEENKLQGMIVDSEEANQLIQKGMIPVRTNENSTINVHKQLWDIYFT